MKGLFSLGRSLHPAGLPTGNFFHSEFLLLIPEKKRK
jgi:hypothetical protein